MHFELNVCLQGLYEHRTDATDWLSWSRVGACPRIHAGSEAREGESRCDGDS